MTIITINWAGVPDGAVSPPAGFTSLGAASASVTSQEWFGGTSSLNTIWGCNTVPSADVFTQTVQVGVSNSNSRGCAVYDSSGNGFMFIARNTDVRVFALASYALSGAALATYTTAVASNANITVETTQSTGTHVVKNAGVTVGTFVNLTYTSGLSAGLLSRSGAVKQYTLEFTPAQTLTIPDDITLLTEYTDNDATGFADGTATLSYGGVDVAVTVASELFDFTLPMIAHDVVSPRLPAVGAEFTLTQGATTATDNANIFLPAGYDTTRVGDVSGGDPANFAGIVDDDPTYLGYAFAQASNDLTTSDSAVFVTSDGYLVGRDTFIQSNEFEIDGITPVLPRTDDLYVWRASTGKYYEHSVTLSDAGVVVVDPSEIIVTGLVNPATGLLQGSYVPIDPNNNWRIAAPFRLDHSYDMIAVSPRAEEAGSMAYFKWADTKSNYKCRFSWFGGEPPFRLTIRRAPLGATIGGSASQVFTRTPDVTVPEMYVHDVPENFAEIDWLPNSGMLGNTYNFSVLVEDQAGRQLVFNWATTVDDTKFKYFDSALGSDTNAGTFELPYQTIGFGFELENSNNYIFKLKDGSYPLNQSAVPNKCRSIIGIGSAAVLDTSAGGISGNFDDFAIMNCDIDGSPVTSGNFKAINVQSRSRRVLFHKLRFKNIVPTSHGDNSSCIFMVGLGTPSVNKHEYISITECSVNTTVKAQMVCTYSSDYVVVDNASGIVDIPNVPYGGKLLHFKDQSSHVSVRFPNVSGVTDNILISFANQYPINAYNQECIYARVNYTGNSAQAAISWNGQGTTAPYKGVSQYLMRASIRGGTQKPVGSESIGVGGEKLNISSCLWSSSDIFYKPDGGELFGTASAQITDGQWDSNMNMVAAVRAANLGYRGAEIASTMVT
jgi:hypothetical protein